MITGQFGESYPPSIDGVGGVMINYCRELNRRGHQSYYIAPQDKKADAPEGVETLLYKSIRIPLFTYHFGFPAMQPDFLERLREIPFDIVHAHTPFMAGMLAKKISQEKQIPLIATFHSKYYDDALRTTHSKTLARKVVDRIVAFYNSCDEVWAVNERTGLVLREYGYRGPIVVMQNGVDIHEQQILGDISDLSLNPEKPLLLFVGQQDYKKGTRELIRAAGRLKEEGHDFHLLMVGDGLDRHALEWETAERGLEDRVTFTGRISDRSRLMAIYRRADLFVFPSTYDNAPLVVREAALQGTPSLVVEGSCAAEGIEQGVNGYLCDGSVTGIARNILAALPSVQTVGEKARLTIPITWELIGGHIEERYTNLIQKRSVDSAAEAELEAPSGTDYP